MSVIPCAPPSPLFVSGSDTESSNSTTATSQTHPIAQNLLGSSAPVYSAPKTIDYFRMTRDNPDAAWNEVLSERQRRKSMQAPGVHPHSHSMMPSMTRRDSHTTSSDSLNSLWHPDSSDLHVSRTTSGPGYLRGMTPMRPIGPRSTSSSSESSSTQATSTQPRSIASQTASEAIPIPAEFGSSPAHTLSLFQSYASAFPVRDASGTSSSYTQRGFAFPDPIATSSRRDSSSSASGSNGLLRPVSGTIRAKSHRNNQNIPTWDSFGKETIEARTRERSNSIDTTHSAEGPNNTPRQSLRQEDGKWYNAPAPLSMPIPRPNQSANTDLSTSTSTAGASRTPLGGRMLPPSSLPARATAMPDLAGMRLEERPSQLLNENGVPRGSVPKSTFNWDKYREQGGLTYSLPKGLMRAGEQGLFHFAA